MNRNEPSFTSDVAIAKIKTPFFTVFIDVNFLNINFRVQVKIVIKICWVTFLRQNEVTKIPREAANILILMKSY